MNKKTTAKIFAIPVVVTILLLIWKVPAYLSSFLCEHRETLSINESVCDPFLGWFGGILLVVGGVLVGILIVGVWYEIFITVSSFLESKIK